MGNGSIESIRPTPVETRHLLRPSEKRAKERVDKPFDVKIPPEYRSDWFLSFWKTGGLWAAAGGACAADWFGSEEVGGKDTEGKRSSRLGTCFSCRDS